ncbi:MAG: flavin reductase family protein [Chloroflexi bacterium]|nr:MAG: flavin reductase family protein [Chloroflexota bacterium]
MTEDTIKEALHRLHYGFYSITSRSGDDLNAMVANWVMQTSFTPRLVAVGLAKKAYTHGLIAAGGVFAINIFNKEDKDAILPFTKARAKRPDKMENAQYTLGSATNCPILAGAAAYLECKVHQIVDVGGDHDIVVGEVINAGILKPGSVNDTLTLPDLGWSYAG